MSSTLNLVENPISSTHPLLSTTVNYEQNGGSPTPANDTSTTSGSGQVQHGSGSGVPGWLGPVVGCLGGLSLVLIVVVAVVLVRRRRRRRRRNADPPPIHNQMCADYKVNKRAPQPLPRSDDGEANARQNEKVMVRTQFNDYRTRRQMKQQPSIRDYKVNKRAPLPLPRSDDETNARQNEKVMVRTQTDYYGYEKPIQSKTSRQMEQQPSIQEPHEYLDFSNTAYEEYATIP